MFSIWLSFWWRLTFDTCQLDNLLLSLFDSLVFNGSLSWLVSWHFHNNCTGTYGGETTTISHSPFKHEKVRKRWVSPNGNSNSFQAHNQENQRSQAGPYLILRVSTGGKGNVSFCTLKTQLFSNGSFKKGWGHAIHGLLNVGEQQQRRYRPLGGCRRRGLLAKWQSDEKQRTSQSRDATNDKVVERFRRCQHPHEQSVHVTNLLPHVAWFFCS